MTASFTYLKFLSYKKTSWDTWITDVAQWMVHQGWATDSEAQKVSAAALARHSHHSNAAPALRILILGEGWRSVGWKLKQLKGNEVHITGVDRRGFQYTGTVQGTITAEIHHDWLDQKTDLLTAISKKASTSVRGWDLVTLEDHRSTVKDSAAGSRTGPSSKRRREDEDHHLRESKRAKTSTSRGTKRKAPGSNGSDSHSTDSDQRAAKRPRRGKMTGLQPVSYT